jgi:hypothetical protein
VAAAVVLKKSRRVVLSLPLIPWSSLVMVVSPVRWKKKKPDKTGTSYAPSLIHSEYRGSGRIEPGTERSLIRKPPSPVKPVTKREKQGGKRRPAMDGKV